MSKGSSPPAQLALDLPKRSALGRADFWVATSNAIALRLIEGWDDWPQHRLALIGPPGSGKSHLVEVWCHLSGATIRHASDPEVADLLGSDAAPLAVEGADTLGTLSPARRDRVEETLFHLLNHQQAAGQPLLITGRRAPAHWPVTLDDLASRLATLTVGEIALPDDALLSSVLTKLFLDRHIRVNAAAIGFLVKRMERSFEAAELLVDRLNTVALRHKRPVTVPLIKEVTGWT